MRALRRIAAAAPMLALAAAGCVAWAPWLPDQSLPDPATAPPSRAIALRPPQSHAGGLDCGAGSCQQWFRVDVDAPGLLRVGAGIEGLGSGAIARLFLQDGTGASLARAVSGDGLPLRVASEVEPGPYAVLLQVGGGPVVYALEVSLDR